MTLLRRDDGQTIIVVAFSLVVLLGALALALDWGYGLTQRRVAQNAADAAAIAAAKALATSTELVDGEIAFRVTQEHVLCVAKAYADQNRSTFLPTGASSDLSLQLGDDATPPNWTSVTIAACSTPTTPVPSSTRYVRAVVGTSYRSLVAAALGEPQIRAQASARARIAGGAAGDYPVWPMVRHYNAADFDTATQCGKRKCDPETVTPFTFWSSTGSQHDMVYGNFKGLVDYSRYSTRFPREDAVPQLIDSWDQTGSPTASPPTAPKDDRSGSCKGPWDTRGGEDPANHDKQCSIPNWAYYAFGGTLALDSKWNGNLNGNTKPSDIGSRIVCSDPPDGLPAPSCAGDSRVGDWVETAFGDLGNGIGAQLSAYIELHGSSALYSDLLVPGEKFKYGKAVVIYVYLWDCAETFNKTWSLVPGDGDCSQVREDGKASVDRVHLFTAAPFTFYAGLVSTQEIKGFWGGGFGDPATCHVDPDSCPKINAFINTAFLVPDEDQSD